MGLIEWLFSMHRPEYQYQNDDGLDAERCALCGIYKTQDPTVAYCSMCGLSFCDRCKINYPERVKWMMKTAMGQKVPYG